MQIGDTYEVRDTVTDQMTAKAFSSGAIRVVSTP